GGSGRWIRHGRSGRNEKGGAHRGADVRILKRESLFYGAFWHHALSAQEGVGYLAEDDSEREARNVQPARSMEGAAKRVREIQIGHWIWRRSVKHASNLGLIECPYHQRDPIVAVNPRHELPASSE